MKWYVVKTKPSQEQLALTELRNQEFEIYYPRMKILRRGVWVFIPLFPSYLFVQLDLDKTVRWQAINGTRGCKQIICMDPEKPSPLPRGFIDDLMKREYQGEFVKVAEKINYKKGDKVLIKEGPFRGHSGICEISTTKRVGILLDLLGSKVMILSELDNILPAS